MSDLLPILIGALALVVGFAVALTRGMVPMMASGCAAATAMVVFFGGLQWLPAVDWIVVEGGFSWPKMIIVLGLSSTVVYVIARIAFGVVLKQMLGTESRFHTLSDGIPAGFLSFFPSLVGLFFLFSGVRIAGTITEMNYTASLAREGVMEMGGKIPEYPKWAIWRDEIEKIPLAAAALDVADPISRRTNRNLAALAIVAQSGSLRSFLLEEQIAGELLNDANITDVVSAPEVVDAVENQERLDLVLGDSIRQFKPSLKNRTRLRNLDLRRSLGGFVESIPPAADLTPAG